MAKMLLPHCFLTALVLIGWAADRARAGAIEFSPVYPTPTSQDLNGVAFADGRFVAVGDGGTIITSVDGLNWLPGETDAFEDLKGVAHGGGQWVAVGSVGSVYTSADGLNWDFRSSGLFLDLHGVTYGDGMFVAVGESSSILTSTDGVEWTGRFWSYESAFSVVAPWAGGFVALKSCCPAELYRSADGLAWAPTGPALTGWVETFAKGGGVAYGHDRHVLIGPAGRIAVSIDGEEIRHVSSAPTGWFRDISRSFRRQLALLPGGPSPLMIPARR